jgi:hypothetical protein
MRIPESIAALEAEWELESGFLGKLRTGHFDAKAAHRLYEVLAKLPFEGDRLDARLVALTWYIPTFVSWQRERCLENGCDPRQFDDAYTNLLNTMEMKLGTP